MFQLLRKSYNVWMMSAARSSLGSEDATASAKNEVVVTFTVCHDGSCSFIKKARVSQVNKETIQIICIVTVASLLHQRVKKSISLAGIFIISILCTIWSCWSNPKPGMLSSCSCAKTNIWSRTLDIWQKRSVIFFFLFFFFVFTTVPHRLNFQSVHFFGWSAFVAWTRCPTHSIVQDATR